MSLQERLTQCQADRAAIEANEQELLDQVKMEKEIETTYRVGDIFWRDEPSGSNCHYLQLRANKEGAVYLTDTKSGIVVYNRVAVKDINAITMAEVQRMTSYPKGLRLVKQFTVIEE